MKKKSMDICLLLVIACLVTTACAKKDPDAAPTPLPKGRLAGLVVLVLGDSHMVHKGYLIDWLHDSLTKEGATVYSFGACGATPADYLMPYKTDCGRASRITDGKQIVEEDGTVPVWNAKDLIAKYHPHLMVVVMGDTMGGYGQPDFPKAWIWDQVSTLTSVIKSANIACNWVGPPWGTEGGLFDKTTARVKQLSEYLSQIVAPCHYIDSTTFAQPGQWKSIDGQHLNGAGYKAWAEAIMLAIQPTPAKAAAPAASKPPW